MSRIPVTVTCSVCLIRETTIKVDGVYPEIPMGWSHLQLAEAGRRVRSFVLCKDHTRVVAVVLELNQ